MTKSLSKSLSKFWIRYFIVGEKYFSVYGILVLFCFILIKNSSKTSLRKITFFFSPSVISLVHPNESKVQAL